MALLTLCLSGCGKSSDKVSISGHVSLRGQPIANGMVMFYPTTGRPIATPLSEAGEYEAELSPGEYTVTVSTGNELPPDFKEGDVPPPPKFVLPPEYTVQAKSTLKATVKPDQEGPIDFALK